MTDINNVTVDDIREALYRVMDMTALFDGATGLRDEDRKIISRINNKLSACCELLEDIIGD